MALLFLDGFEGYASIQQMVQMRGIPAWVQYGGTVSPNFNATSRTSQVTAANSRALCLPNGTGTTSWVRMSLPNLTELIVGFGYFNTNIGNNPGPIINFYGSNINSAGILLNLLTTGFLTAYIPNATGQPGTLLGTSTNQVLASNTWSYLEMRVKLGTTTGEFELKVNGVQEMLLTGINTATGGLTSYSNLMLGYDSSASEYYLFDDFYLCDTTGTVNNTFLGPIGVYTLLPTAAGSSTDMAVTGAANNFTAQADQVDTSYVTSVSTGQKDYYAFQDLPAGVTTVAGVQVRARARSTYITSRTLYLKLKNGINTLTSAAKSLAVSTFYYENHLSETAPDGSAWTPTSVNATEAGVEGN